jgi:hypothetical protein
VEQENFDTLTGVTRQHRQVNHSEVVRLRNANPHESLEMLAHRLGCSLSTVKRHLRRERRQPSVGPATAIKPSVDELLAAAAIVTGAQPVRRSSQAA